MKTRNAKPPRKISKGRLFYLQVENLCQFKSIYTPRNTLRLREQVSKIRSWFRGAWIKAAIFGTLAGLNFVEQGLQTLLLCRGIEDKNLEEKLTGSAPAVKV